MSEENVYDERFAISGAITMAIAEFDSKVSQKEEASDEIDWRDNASEWSFQYREHILGVVEHVLDKVTRTTNYGQLSLWADEAAEHYSNKMLNAYEEEAYE